MTYQRFAASKIDDYPAGFVTNCMTAAQAEYSDLPYHNWHHAQAVIDGVTIIADKLHHHGITTARHSLLIAAAWHDSGYHRDHTALGYPTKEAYSAALLLQYLTDTPVTTAQKQLLHDVIVATWHHYPTKRTPLQTILHRADIANIGGPASQFTANSYLLWHEACQRGTPRSWHQHCQQSAAFITALQAEHRRESQLNGLNPHDTNLDVNNEPFLIAAKRNQAILAELPPPRHSNQI